MRSTRGCGSLDVESHALVVVESHADVESHACVETADRQVAKDVDRKKRAAETC